MTDTRSARARPPPWRLRREGAALCAARLALLWAVEKTLGKAFTPEVKDAWATAYIVLSTTMIDAAWPASLKARG